MRHRKSGVKLNRTTSHRQAMFRNMVTSLFKYDRIKTTDTKAKELRRWADHIITLAKRGDLNARRQALAIVREKEVVHKLFEEVQKRFGTVNGGYTRIIKIGHRAGDAAAVSLIELVTVEAPAKKKKAAPKKQTAAGTKKAKVEPKADTAAKKTDAEADTPAEEAAAEEATPEPAKKPAAKSKAPEKKAAAKKAPAKKAAAKAEPKETKAAKSSAKKADEDKA